MAMGFQIKVPFVHLPYDRQVGDLHIPVTDGLMGQWLLGGSLGFSAKNRWAKSGYGDGEVFGSPGISDYYLSLKSGSSGITLPFTDTQVGTWISVVRITDTLADAAHRPLFLGTSPTAGENGANMFMFSSTSARMSAYFDDGTNAGNNDLTNPSLSVWRMLIGKFDLTSISLRDRTAGDVAPASTTGTTRMVGDAPMSIGGRPGATVQGMFDCAYAGIFNRVLSVAEHDAVYAMIQKLLAPRGIAI